MAESACGETSSNTASLKRGFCDLFGGSRKIGRPAPNMRSPNLGNTKSRAQAARLEVLRQLGAKLVAASPRVRSIARKPVEWLFGDTLSASISLP